MSGDGSSYSSRLSDGYISNVRACEKTREGKKRKEKHEEEGNGRKKSENGVSSGGKWTQFRSHQTRRVTGEAGTVTGQQCCITDGHAKSLGVLLLLLRDWNGHFPWWTKDMMIVQFTQKTHFTEFPTDRQSLDSSGSWKKNYRFKDSPGCEA